MSTRGRTRPRRRMATVGRARPGFGSSPRTSTRASACSSQASAGSGRDDASVRRTSRSPSASAVPALPERCPRCDAVGSNRDRRELLPGGRSLSDPRAHDGNGPCQPGPAGSRGKTVAESPARRRTIVFTDSRDDAASTAAGVELNHFRDLVRQLMTSELAETVSPPELMRRARGGRRAWSRTRRLLEVYKRDDADAWAAYRLEARGSPRSPTWRRWLRFESVTEATGADCRGRLFSSGFSDVWWSLASTLRARTSRWSSGDMSRGGACTRLQTASGLRSTPR